MMLVAMCMAAVDLVEQMLEVVVVLIDTVAL